MMRFVIPFLSGSAFAAGLAWSGMTNPQNVRGFLDLLGNWDPRLALVMGAALAIAVPVELWLRRRGRPLLAAALEAPRRTRVDGALIVGAAIFGVGWGLVGLCPGPAVVLFGAGVRELLWFMVAVAAGMGLEHVLWRRASRDVAGDA